MLGRISKIFNLVLVLFLLATFSLPICTSWADCLCQGTCYCYKGRKMTPVSIKTTDIHDTCDERDFCRDVCSMRGYMYRSESVNCTYIGGCPMELIYGEDSQETELLRYFRDNVLSQTPEGQNIIDLYYEWSPIIVKMMEEDEEFKEKVQSMIDEILPMIVK